MKQKEGFVLRTVCGEHVIVGEGLGTIDFGKLISLNETAAWLWKKADEMGDFDIDSLTKALCEEYDVEPDQARQDVTKMVGHWQELGIVEG
ncbi:Coenzyme PQQ synthesis protein D (PqqD) [Prevotellaceae bacterium MN60]|nr:Coenzyme PQQ synthesis protein D (PqqD) [Prevotellaceae bacterium MN60]